jgi:tagatose-1,6-bisphosphate aldolase non-catalytic subunit AgaZ/GatZ
MKTIKVIDLLNMIVNGEVPKKIKYGYDIYEYNKEEQDYIYFETGEDKYVHLIEDEIICTFNLLEEIEIIEDTPKEIYFDEEDIKAEEKVMKELSIEKKDNYNNYYKKDKKIEKMEFCYEVSDKMQNANNERFKDFINEIIEVINGRNI